MKRSFLLRLRKAISFNTVCKNDYTQNKAKLDQAFGFEKERKR